MVDNGSRDDDFAYLATLGGRFKLVRLSVNRFFGEGNNIGVEASRGRYVLFLNNDAFVTPNWLAPLIDTLETAPDAGGVGPLFLYPDDRLQEAGALIDANGIAVQVGKFPPFDPEDITRRRVVDYCSAACFAMPRALFDRVLGFDLIWEPAYYEDSDLGLKIAVAGHKVYYCPDSRVYHIENATSSDRRNAMRLDNIVEINRTKFLARWGDYLRAREAGDTALPAPKLADFTYRPTPADGNRPVAVIYSPYELIPGGGERYLLSVAVALKDSHLVYLATDAAYSTLRLGGLGRELELDLSFLRLITRDDIPRLPQIDVMIAMGNEALPHMPAYGRRTIYHCQFPFPMYPVTIAQRWGNLAGYQTIAVNSAFTAGHMARVMTGFHMPQPDIEIAFPPVAPILPEAVALSAQRGQSIVSIGRFFAGGHSKRQDVLIDALRLMHQRGSRAELHLVGALHPQAEHRQYLLELKQRAEGLPVHFHLNAAPDRLRALLAEASLYWHATGYDVLSELNPQRCEHFGISIVEAMSAGCVPLVVDRGGPVEFVRDGETGRTYASVEALAEMSLDLLAHPDRLTAMRRAGIAEAKRFTPDAFAARWQSLVQSR